jgi:predicted MFS family arabinose efflux permease
MTVNFDDERTSLLQHDSSNARSTSARTATPATSLLSHDQKGPTYQTMLATPPTTSDATTSDVPRPLRDDESESDGALPHTDAHPAPATAIWTIFPVLLLGILLSNIISSIVLATATYIASSFDALASASWLLTTYTLSQSASQPLYGKLSTIFGRRACLTFCWLVFGIGCLLSGLGTRFWVVVLGRVVAGVGSAGKIALTSVVVADLVPLSQVAKYRAYVNLTATVARSLGGPVGGVLAGRVGWRWPFVVQFPVAVAGLALVLWKLPAEKDLGGNVGEGAVDDGDKGVDDGEAEGKVGGKKVSGFTRVDFAGATSLSATIVSGMMALDLGSKGYPPLVLGGLGLAFVLCMGLFVYVEKCYAKEPILPLDLVGRREVMIAYLMIGFQAAGQFGLLYTIPIYFQVAMGESISAASARIVPVVLGNALGTILSGRLITRQKRYKLLAVFANTSGFVGFALMVLRWHGQTSTAEAFYVILPGLGMGIMQSVTFVHLAASVSHDEVPIAGTSWFLAQNIGALVGASITTSLINRVLRASLQAVLAGEPNAGWVRVFGSLQDD